MQGVSEGKSLLGDVAYRLKACLKTLYRMRCHLRVDLDHADLPLTILLRVIKIKLTRMCEQEAPLWREYNSLCRQGRLQQSTTKHGEAARGVHWHAKPGRPPTATYLARKVIQRMSKPSSFRTCFTNGTSIASAGKAEGHRQEISSLNQHNEYDPRSITPVPMGQKATALRGLFVCYASHSKIMGSR